ncbi:MAG TPA: hypothetical protein VG941_02585 [Candidatus Paceibacterota bacterium]|nr:hypothetical protein [Candidatus Paceibacterota bacterium]
MIGIIAMSPRAFITIGVMIGSTVGGYIPVLWGDSAFSLVSIFFAFLGGLVGIYFGWRISQSM